MNLDPAQFGIKLLGLGSDGCQHYYIMFAFRALLGGSNTNTNCYTLMKTSYIIYAVQFLVQIVVRYIMIQVYRYKYKTTTTVFSSL